MKQLSIILTTLILILILISCKKDESPTETRNSAPKIESISADPSTIKVNQETTLSSVVTDQDGDELTVTWTSENGTFPNGNRGETVKWKAPETAAAYGVTATVSDGMATDKENLNVIVEENGGGVDEPCPSSVSHAGKTYNTVQIGDQCWFKENLNVGTKINSTAGVSQQTDNNIIEKYCYDNDEANCDIYGGLYEWNEAMQYVTTEGTKGICPDGWHIPSYAEMQILVNEVGTDGNALKAQGQGSGDGAGTNTSGFSGLIAGGRDINGGNFYDLGNNANVWSSTESDGAAYDMTLNFNHSAVYFYSYLKNFGFSVRCLKD